jgi:hypothetical protein
MFRAAQRSSSGALNCVYSLWFIYKYIYLYINQRLQIQFRAPDNELCASGLYTNIYVFIYYIYLYINQRLQKQFRAPDDERCAARNMLSF